MSQDAPSPGVIPYLLYEDVGAALDWLHRVFGFTERMRYAEPNGTISHAEMTTETGTFMLGHPGPDYRDPRHHGHVSQLVVVSVADVDAHYRHAKAAGAAPRSEPKDQPYGERSYQVDDLAGHRWVISQHIRDVPPEEWGAGA